LDNENKVGYDEGIVIKRLINNRIEFIENFGKEEEKSSDEEENE